MQNVFSVLAHRETDPAHIDFTELRSSLFALIVRQSLTVRAVMFEPRLSETGNIILLGFSVTSSSGCDFFQFNAYREQMVSCDNIHRCETTGLLKEADVTHRSQASEQSNHHSHKASSTETLRGSQGTVFNICFQS